MENKRKIKDIYNISFQLIDKKDRCQMDEWYDELINKRYNEIDLFDVTRMIIQKTFLDLAVLKAKDYLKEDLFCGWRYDGELLELLSNINMCYLKKDKEFFQNLVKKEENKIYDWLCEEKRRKFQKILNDFSKKIADK